MWRRQRAISKSLLCFVRFSLYPAWPSSIQRLGQSLKILLKARQKMHVERNIEERSCERCCSGKAINTVLHDMSVCICSLQYRACNVHAPYCHLWPCPALQYFSTYLIKGKIFEKKMSKSIKCAWIRKTN